MRSLFYIGLIGLSLFEVLNVYFIMPMPGSQRIDSIDLAYFLYSYRWYFRIVFLLLALIGSFQALQTTKKWIPGLVVVLAIAVTYLFNFRMTADHMFLQPESITFHSRAENTLSDSTLIIAVTLNNEAKAYPIRYIVYHHQVRDTLGGKPIMVTYCSVCRTGRVFEPQVSGKPENFRLVGMDHFNAMFEDETTKSWWRQATGEAVTGPLKGQLLPEIESQQLTMGKFFFLYPFGKVMQAEVASIPKYDTLGKFEQGKSKSKLTGTDSLSWKDKSWVVGIQIENKTKAYDWNELKHQQLIHDSIGSIPILLVLSGDGQSFGAFRRRTHDEHFVIRNDSLISTTSQYDFSGRNADGSTLEAISAYQEFWHSWRTFHPETRVYKNQ
ncbi:MAG: DUF3179 domain-containing (seleno)protein [Cyclobacteriaceae bacterium]|nr:MAG: DUF3179 domain-containing (seleno)protein [Cyclobacteriaceae bacterium]